MRAYFNDPQQYREPGHSGWVPITRGTGPRLPAPMISRSERAESSARPCTRS